MMMTQTNIQTQHGDWIKLCKLNLQYYLLYMIHVLVLGSVNLQLYMIHVLVLGSVN